MENLDLTKQEMQLFELSLEGTVFRLDEQYDGDPRYVNPADKYKDLLAKLSQWRESNYTEAYRLTPLQ